MGHYQADAFTANPAPAVHAGLNAQICKYTLSETASSSLTIALTPIPAGAEIVDVTVGTSNNNWGTGGETIDVFATIGGIQPVASAQYVFMNAASAGGISVVRPNIGKDLGKRITASANLFLSVGGAVDTGTASVEITAVVQYLRNKRGD